MVRYQLDRTDEELVRQLRRDGRTGFAELARTIGVSPDSARSRFNRLTGDGILRVVGVVEPIALGYGAIADVWLTFRGATDELAKVGAAHPNITFMSQTLGRQNVLCEVAGRDDADLADIIEATFLSRDDVAEVDVWRTLEIVKWESQGRAPSDVTARPAGEDAPLSDLDRALLRILVVDPRTSFRELADQVDQPYWLVRRRTQALFEHGTIRATAMIDRVSTGTQLLANVVIEMGAGARDVMRTIAGFSEVALLSLHTGEFQCSAEVTCASPAALAELGLRIASVGGVRRTEIRPYVRTLVVPMPWRFEGSG